MMKRKAHSQDHSPLHRLAAENPPPTQVCIVPHDSRYDDMVAEKERVERELKQVRDREHELTAYFARLRNSAAIQGLLQDMSENLRA